MRPYPTLTTKRQPPLQIERPTAMGDTPSLLWLMSMMTSWYRPEKWPTYFSHVFTRRLEIFPLPCLNALVCAFMMFHFLLAVSLSLLLCTRYFIGRHSSSRCLCNTTTTTTMHVYGLILCQLRLKLRMLTEDPLPPMLPPTSSPRPKIYT